MKRSPIQRRQPLRATGPASTSLPTTRCKAKGCRNRFVQRSMTHRACSPECAASLVDAIKAKDAAKTKAEDKRKTRAQLEALKTIPQLKKEAQAAFNAWVRWRDRNQPCISCGAPPPDLSRLHAGRDCGHYRSVGAADHLRFDPHNAHAQCVNCNQHKAGNVVAYRQGLLARIGAARLEALESNNDTVKWTREGLRVTRDVYRRAVRQLEKESQ